MTPILEGPVRRRFFSREKCLEQSGLVPGMRVLEVGPGGGFLTEAAARLLGPGGSLVCLDLQLDMLRKVCARLAPHAPALVCASGSVLPFREGALDLVFLVGVLGEIPDKDGALRECRRVLRPGGLLAVTESLPDPDYIRAPILRRRALRAGFELGDCFSTLAGYTHRFVRPAPPARER
jgi:ubiquinone/menaquinone biosynthesis C-methylase UbiE